MAKRGKRDRIWFVGDFNAVAVHKAQIRQPKPTPHNQQLTIKKTTLKDVKKINKIKLETKNIFAPTP
jgi:hypothetical protein